MRIVRWIGIVVGGLVGLIVLGVGVVYALSGSRIGKKYEIAGTEVAVPTDSASIAWGEHIAKTRGCTGCHGADLGGGEFINVPIVAQLYTANLTGGQGGAGGRYTSNADWERSIRHGVAPDGHALLFMPAHEFYPVSDHDLGALIAYIRSRPAVDRAHPEQKVGPVGRMLFVSGQLPLIPAELVQHDAPRPAAPVPGPTAEYGGYLATTCQGCHGVSFGGGPIPGAPPEMLAPRNITMDSATGIGRWTRDDFAKAVRTGIRPDGSNLGKDMPAVENFSGFSDDEVTAIWMYLQTVPRKVYGTR